MPIIRGEFQNSLITEEQRRAIVDQLVQERMGTQTSKGPIIFEIPFDEGAIDVLVVWDEWKPFSSTQRTNLIREAYQGVNTRIAQALGVTYQEAIDQQVLPYSVVPMSRSGEINEDEARTAMLEMGGYLNNEGKVDLRFPTMAFAEHAHKQLADRLPQGYWSIVYKVNDIP